MSTQVNVSPLHCKISDIDMMGPGKDPDDVIKKGEPFSLRTQVSFSGAGAAAFVGLGPIIRVTYFAESIGPGNELELGTATATATIGQLVYDLTLDVPIGTSLQLNPEAVYQLAASLRIGALNAPAAVNGFSEGMPMQVYAP